MKREGKDLGEGRGFLSQGTCIDVEYGRGNEGRPGSTCQPSPGLKAPDGPAGIRPADTRHRKPGKATCVGAL